MKSLKSLLTLTSLALAVSGSALATNTSVLLTKEDVVTNSKSMVESTKADMKNAANDKLKSMTDSASSTKSTALDKVKEAKEKATSAKDAVKEKASALKEKASDAKTKAAWQTQAQKRKGVESSYENVSVSSSSAVLLLPQMLRIFPGLCPRGRKYASVFQNHIAVIALGLFEQSHTLFSSERKYRSRKRVTFRGARAHNGHGDQTVLIRIAGARIENMMIVYAVKVEKALVNAGRNDGESVNIQNLDDLVRMLLRLPNRNMEGLSLRFFPDAKHIAPEIDNGALHTLLE